MLSPSVLVLDSVPGPDCFLSRRWPTEASYPVQLSTCWVDWGTSSASSPICLFLCKMKVYDVGPRYEPGLIRLLSESRDTIVLLLACALIILGERTGFMCLWKAFGFLLYNSSRTGCTAGWHGRYIAGTMQSVYCDPP